MKKIKNFTLGLLGVTILSLGLYACSGDDVENINQQSIEKRANSIDTEDKIKNIAKELDVDIRIDPSVNKDNSIVFDSEEEYREFIIKIKKQINNNEIILESTKDSQFSESNYVTLGKCSDGVYRGSGLTSGFATLGFDVSVTNGCISGISGNFTGFTLGVSYTQGGTSYGCSSGTVCGNVNYNLFLEGIGTVYSQRVCYSLSLNC